MATQDIFSQIAPEQFAALGAIIAAFLVIFVVVALALYVYSAITLMTVAKRTKTPNEWLAWIPVGNLVLMANIAKMHWWPVLLIIGIFIPFVGWILLVALWVFGIIWTWKICEARSKPGWWAVLTIIPFLGWIWGLVMWGILAWAKD